MILKQFKSKRLRIYYVDRLPKVILYKLNRCKCTLSPDSAKTSGLRKNGENKSVVGLCWNHKTQRTGYRFTDVYVVKSWSKTRDVITLFHELVHCLVWWSLPLKYECRGSLWWDLVWNIFDRDAQKWNLEYYGPYVEKEIKKHKKIRQ